MQSQIDTMLSHLQASLSQLKQSLKQSSGVSLLFSEKSLAKQLIKLKHVIEYCRQATADQKEYHNQYSYFSRPRYNKFRESLASDWVSLDSTADRNLNAMYGNEKVSEVLDDWLTLLHEINAVRECSLLGAKKFSKIQYFMDRFVEDRPKAGLRFYSYANSSGKSLFERCCQAISKNNEGQCYNTNSYSEYVRRFSSTEFHGSVSLSPVSLHSFFKSLQQSAQPNPQTNFVPSPCYYKCWNCIEAFYKGQILQQSIDKQFNNLFIIDFNEATHQIQWEQLNEIYCRAANKRTGVILVGLKKVEEGDQSLQARTSWSGGEVEIVNSLLETKRKQTTNTYIRFQAVGVNITQIKTYEVETKLLQAKSLMSEVLIFSHNIRLIPVYAHPLKQTACNSSRFVIQINIEFDYPHPINLIYYQIIAPAHNPLRNQYHVFGEELGQDSIQGKKLSRQALEEDTSIANIPKYCNKLYGRDVYAEIVKSWKNKHAYHTMRKEHANAIGSAGSLNSENGGCRLLNYPVKCRAMIETEFMEYRNTNDRSVQRMEDEVDKKDTYDSNIYNHNENYYEACLAKQPYHQQQPMPNPEVGSMYFPKNPQQLPSAKDPYIFGYAPQLIYGHSSLLISPATSSSIGTKLEERLKELKCTYKIYYTFYEKLPFCSPQLIQVITHTDSWQKLNSQLKKIEKTHQQQQIAQSQGPTKLQLVRKQLLITSPYNASPAIAQLRIRMHMLYGHGFKLGVHQHGILLQFREKTQAIFGYVVCRKMGIASKMMNSRGVSTLNMTDV